MHTEGKTQLWTVHVYYTLVRKILHYNRIQNCSAHYGVIYSEPDGVCSGIHTEGESCVSWLESVDKLLVDKVDLILSNFRQIVKLIHPQTRHIPNTSSSSSSSYNTHNAPITNWRQNIVQNIQNTKHTYTHTYALHCRNTSSTITQNTKHTHTHIRTALQEHRQYNYSEYKTHTYTHTDCTAGTPAVQLLRGSFVGFLPAGATHCTDYRETWQGVVPCQISHWRTLGDRAFPVVAARAWNSLPSSIRDWWPFDSSWRQYCSVHPSARMLMSEPRHCQHVTVLCLLGGPWQCNRKH